MPHRGRWLLISPPSDAPSPRRLASGFLLPRLPQQRPRDHGEHVLAKIGTAMLSYAEHGKFRPQTQGHRPFFPELSGAGKGERIKALASPFCGSVFRNVRRAKWTTAGAQAQWAAALPTEEAAIRSLRRPDEPTRAAPHRIAS